MTNDERQKQLIRSAQYIALGALLILIALFIAMKVYVVPAGLSAAGQYTGVRGKVARL